MKLKFEWELLEKQSEGYPIDRTYRVKVFGGWLLYHEKIDSESMTFIPDPKHEWEIDTDET